MGDDAEVYECECEMDWRCGLHADQPTYLETRFEDDGDGR